MLFTNKVIKNYKAFAKFRAIKTNDSVLKGKKKKRHKKQTNKKHTEPQNRFIFKS